MNDDDHRVEMAMLRECLSASVVMTKGSPRCERVTFGSRVARRRLGRRPTWQRMGPVDAKRHVPICQAVAKPTSSGHDYDLIIIGCGVGGHGAALHAVEQVQQSMSTIPSHEWVTECLCLYVRALGTEDSSD